MDVEVTGTKKKQKEKKTFLKLKLSSRDVNEANPKFRFGHFLEFYDNSTSSFTSDHLSCTNMVCIYSRTSVARTLMARLPRLFRTRS